MSRIVTHAELVAVPDGSVYHLEEGAELTPLAAERAQARGIRITRAGAGTRDGETAGLSPDELDGLIGQITSQVIERLGRLGPLGPDELQRLSGRVASEVLAVVSERERGAGTGGPLGMPPSADYCAAYLEQERNRSRRRAVITATGRNQKGIVARFAAAIAEQGGDILDIAQTLVGDFFTMLVIVDIGDLAGTFSDFKAAIKSTAEQLGAQAILMHEDLVSSLHRV